MKKTLLLILPALFAFTSLHAATAAVKNELMTVFYEGTTQVAVWKTVIPEGVTKTGNIIDGDIKIYFGAGEERISTNYRVVNNSVEDGIYKWSDKEGKVIMEETFQKGLMNGPYKRYFASGQTALLGNYLNSLKHGVFNRYYDNGETSQTAEYKYGMLEGDVELYYPSGAIKERYTYVKGKKNGEYIKYFESGGIMTEGKYINDLKEGIFQNYYESGEEIDFVEYRKGKLIKGKAAEEKDFSPESFE